MSLAGRVYVLPEGERVVIIVGGVIVTGVVAPRTSEADKPFLLLTDVTINGKPFATFQCLRDAVQGFGTRHAPTSLRASSSEQSI